jgi:hypothetical protein
MTKDSAQASSARGKMPSVAGKKPTQSLKRSNATDEEKLEVRCVQGSTLGPHIFTLYTSQITEFVCYADDSYLMIIEDDIKVAINRISTTSKIQVEYLKSLGMKVNTSKTEVVIFNKKEDIIHEIPLADTTVTSQLNMKVLGVGVTFDQKLTWEKHIRQTVAKSSAKLSVLQNSENFTCKNNSYKFLQVNSSASYIIARKPGSHQSQRKNFGIS